MTRPAVLELNLAPADLVRLKRLRRTAGDDPRDAEIAALRTSVDELADENSELRLLLEMHGIEAPE